LVVTYIFCIGCNRELGQDGQEWYLSKEEPDVFCLLPFYESEKCTIEEIQEIDKGIFCFFIIILRANFSMFADIESQLTVNRTGGVVDNCLGFCFFALMASPFSGILVWCAYVLIHVTGLMGEPFGVAAFSAIVISILCGTAFVAYWLFKNLL
jgi:hypothetical protein